MSHPPHQGFKNLKRGRCCVAPYSGMGVYHKVTEDSFSQGWGTRPPARFIFTTQELCNKHTSSESGLCLVRLVSLGLWPWSHCGCPLWRAFLGGEASFYDILEDLAHPSTCIEGRSRALLVCREVGFSLAPRILLPRVQRLVSGETTFLGVAHIRSAKIHIKCMSPQIWNFSGEIWSGPSWITGQWLCPRHPHPGPQIVHSRACVYFPKYNLFIQILASVLVLANLAFNPPVAVAWSAPDLEGIKYVCLLKPQQRV